MRILVISSYYQDGSASGKRPVLFTCLGSLLDCSSAGIGSYSTHVHACSGSDIDYDGGGFTLFKSQF